MKMTLMQHFGELKRRVVWSLAFFALAFAVGFYIAPEIESLVSGPLLDIWQDGEMIYTGIADPMSIQFSLAGLFAVLASSPFVLYQIWAYVSPALRKNERGAVMAMMILSPVLFAAGAMFAYFALLPVMFRFFIDLAGQTVRMLPDMKSYLVFSIEMLKAFGLAFQFPLVLVLLNRAGVLSKKTIFSASRYVIVGIFLLAAVMTPPDVVSQIALALPLVLLFGLSFPFMI